MEGSREYWDVLPHAFAAYRAAHCCAHCDQGDYQCYHQERPHFHAEDDSRWSIIGLEAVFAFVVARVVGGCFSYDGVLVRGWVDGVVVLEAVGGRDFGRIVVLIQGGQPLRLALRWPRVSKTCATES